MLARATLPGDHIRLTLRAAQVAAVAAPGQFLHIAPAPADPWPAAPSDCPPALSEASVLRPLLRRPLGVHAVHGPRYEPDRLRRGQSVQARGDAFDVLLKVVGRGTSLLAERLPGDQVDLVGPLGRPFEIRAELETALLVAGGAGIAPLFFLAQELRAQGKRTRVLVGAASEDTFPLQVRPDGAERRVAPLEEIGAESLLVTEREQALLVTEYLEAHLDGLMQRVGEVEIFACGPVGMLAEVARLAGDSIPCQVLLEERMCCGLGACRGCVTRVRDPHAPEGFVLRTVCGDGPVFRARDILWE